MPSCLLEAFFSGCFRNDCHMKLNRNESSNLYFWMERTRKRLHFKTSKCQLCKITSYSYLICVMYSFTYRCVNFLITTISNIEYVITVNMEIFFTKKLYYVRTFFSEVGKMAVVYVIQICHEARIWFILFIFFLSG